MKFTSFKEFRGISATIEKVSDYLSVDMRKIIRELSVGLTKLNFADNFDSFTESVTIAAGAELQIQNKIATIPSGYLIVRATGTGIYDGTSTWTVDNVYLKNGSGGSITATVIFFK